MLGEQLIWILGGLANVLSLVPESDELTVNWWLFDSTFLLV